MRTALLIFLAALAFWIPAQFGLLQARRDLDSARTRLADLQNRIAASEAELNAARQRQRTQSQARDLASAAAAKAARELAKVDPSSRWAIPPASLPEWNPDSPYVWLPKDFISKIGAPIFKRDGELRDDAATMFDLDDNSRRALNRQVGQLLSNYHALEVSNVERLADPAGNLSIDGPTVTLRINPMAEAGAQVQQEFANTLQETLGQQRGALMNECAQDWLEEQFDHFGKTAKVISVVHHATGGFSLAIEQDQYGSQSTSLSGDDPSALGSYIPDYLLPLFNDATAAIAPAQ
jgi:hypothetical protein